MLCQPHSCSYFSQNDAESPLHAAGRFPYDAESPLHVAGRFPHGAERPLHGAGRFPHVFVYVLQLVGNQV